MDTIIHHINPTLKRIVINYMLHAFYLRYGWPGTQNISLSLKKKIRENKSNLGTLQE